MKELGLGLLLNGGMHTPLEQFKIIVLKPIKLLGIWDVSITNAVVYLLLVSFFIYLLYGRGLREGRLFSDVVQSIAEKVYIFMNNLVKEQSGIRGLKYFPVFFLLFNIILFLNLVGLTPFGFTCTSQAVCTFTLGFSMFIGIVLIGLTVLRVDFVKLFLPDITGPILPLIIVIEIFSYLIRPFSLSIRLFANMLAGHTLLHILSGFCLGMLNVDFILALVMLLPIIAICVLELGIAFLQAYVFVVLVCIYMKESLYGH